MEGVIKNRQSRETSNIGYTSPTRLDLNSAILLKQQTIGRRIAPLRHTNLITAQPIFALTP